MMILRPGVAKKVSLDGAVFGQRIGQVPPRQIPLDPLGRGGCVSASQQIKADILKNAPLRLHPEPDRVERQAVKKCIGAEDEAAPVNKFLSSRFQGNPTSSGI